MGRLSLSMIVKNEEKFLKGCLESVKGVVDEIILVDTGSTDGTIKIAGEYGTKIYHFDWINDFSAARNYSLSKCSGEWILYLDADERLDKESVEELKKIISGNSRKGVYCNIYNVDEVNNKPKLMKYTRLFRNSEGIKFSGRAHEQIENSLKNSGYSFTDSGIIITHLGYNLDKNGLEQKARRNLKLLLEDYKNSKSSYTAFQLGNTYSILDDREKASDYYSLAIKDPALNRDFYGICSAYIADFYLKMNDLQKSLGVLESGLKKVPEHPILNLVGSEIMFKAGDGAVSVQLCKIAYEQNKKLSQGKKGGGILEVVTHKDKILYHGLHAAVQKNIPEGIEYFLGELEKTFENTKYRFEDEISLIVALANSTQLERNVLSQINLIVSDHNLDFYLGLLGNYRLPETKISVLRTLCEKFSGNILVWNKLGLAYSKNNNTQKAIEVFEDLLKRFPSQPTPVFYLVSLYVEIKEFDKVRNLITQSKTKFSGNVLFRKHIKDIEGKLENIIAA